MIQQASQSFTIPTATHDAAWLHIASFVRSLAVSLPELHFLATIPTPSGGLCFGEARVHEKKNHEPSTNHVRHGCRACRADGERHSDHRLHGIGVCCCITGAKSQLQRERSGCGCGFRSLCSFSAPLQSSMLQIDTLFDRREHRTPDASPPVQCIGGDREEKERQREPIRISNANLSMPPAASFSCRSRRRLVSTRSFEARSDSQTLYLVDRPPLHKYVSFLHTQSYSETTHVKTNVKQ